MSVELTRDKVDGIEIATVTLENPPLNVLDHEHCLDMVSCLKEIYADDRARLIVLRGAGKAFSAGVDIAQHTREQMPELLPAFHDVFHHLLRLRGFTVAAVHGHCLGGAAELALACDRIVADKTASIGLPEITLGCFPPVAIPLFPHRLPHGRAIEMMISGKSQSLEELSQLGVVDRVVPKGQLDQGIAAEVELVRGKSPAILSMVADLIHREARLKWADRIEVMEKEYLEILLPHPDVDEGIDAFLKKRTPEWQDPDERPDPLESLI